MFQANKILLLRSPILLLLFYVVAVVVTPDAAHISASYLCRVTAASANDADDCGAE
jgi:hypothetical protein